MISFFQIVVALILLNALSAEAKERTHDWPRDQDTGILLGAEPFYLPGDNGAAVLLIHGFSSSPREMRELGGRLNEAGFTVSGIRLKGHGTKPGKLREARWEDWYAQTEGEYLKLRARHRRVFAAGFSLGGVLALHLAARRELSGVVGLAPAIEVTHKWYYLLPPAWYARSVGRLIRYVVKIDRWIKVNDKSQAATHLAYSHISLAAARELLELASKVRGEASTIEEPLLFLHSPSDEAASFKGSRTFMEATASKSKRLVPLERSNHLITLDYDKELVFDEVLRFLDEHSR